MPSQRPPSVPPSEPSPTLAGAQVRAPDFPRGRWYPRSELRSETTVARRSSSDGASHSGAGPWLDRGQDAHPIELVKQTRRAFRKPVPGKGREQPNAHRGDPVPREPSPHRYRQGEMERWWMSASSTSSGCSTGHWVPAGGLSCHFLRPTASRLDTRATGKVCSHLAARASRCVGAWPRGSSSAE